MLIIVLLLYTSLQNMLARLAHCQLVDLVCIFDSASFAVTEASSTSLVCLSSGPDGQTHLLQNPNTTTFSAQLTAVGTHTLSVCLVDDHTQQSTQLQPATQLRGVTVVPSAVCPGKTTVEAVPDRLVAGVACTCRIYPVDAFGNAGASGTPDLVLSSSASHVLHAVDAVCSSSLTLPGGLQLT